MFDGVGWSEMAVIVVVGLLVIGPKELPKMLKLFSDFMKKMRGYSRDFQKGVDQIVKDAGLEEARTVVKTVGKSNPTKALSNLVDPTGELTKEIKDVDKAARQATQTKTPVTSDTANKDVAAVAAPPVQQAAAPETAPPPEPAKPVIVQAPFQMAPAHSIRPPAPPAKANGEETPQ